MNRTKKSLKQKLAMALSVVNALNVCAPIALPYVNVARNVRAEGGNTEPLSDGLARAFYGTAQAYTSTVENTSVYSEAIPDGGTQNVNDGGYTSATSVNNGGVQNVNSSGYASHTSVNNGGTQNVNNGGTANATLINNDGVQNANDGGTANYTSVNNGGV
ncbi:MAG: AIDA repeat-containing protein, partial [Schwartzia sp.]|nr:AIDA repeat-containing protein [Schwartzia sp. (in: firmicutes)]